MLLSSVPSKCSWALLSTLAFSATASERISLTEGGGQFTTPVIQLSVAAGATGVAGVIGYSDADRLASQRIVFQSGFNLFVKNKDPSIPYITVNRAADDPAQTVSVFDHYPVSISANGKWVGFSNRNGNQSAQYGSATFVPPEIDNGGDAFVRHLESDALVQIVGSSFLGKPAFSANGECVVFSNNSAKEIQVARIGHLNDLSHSDSIDIIARIPDNGFYNTNRRYFGINGNCSEVIYRTDDAKDSNKDGYGSSDIYAHNIITGQDELISTNSQGVRLYNPRQTGQTINNKSLQYPSFSAFANLVAFEGVGLNPETGEKVKKVYVKNRLTGELRDLSSASNGFSGLCTGVNALVCNVTPQMSPTGEYVAFYTSALANSDSDPSGDNSGKYTAVVYEYNTQKVLRSDFLTTSQTANGNVNDDQLAIDIEGVYQATDAAIDTGDSNATIDIYFDVNPLSAQQ